MTFYVYIFHGHLDRSTIVLFSKILQRWRQCNNSHCWQEKLLFFGSFCYVLFRFVFFVYFFLCRGNSKERFDGRKLSYDYHLPFSWKNNLIWKVLEAAQNWRIWWLRNSFFDLISSCKEIRLSSAPVNLFMRRAPGASAATTATAAKTSLKNRTHAFSNFIALTSGPFRLSCEMLADIHKG